MYKKHNNVTFRNLELTGKTKDTVLFVLDNDTIQKNKISQLGHSPKSLGNLILPTLQFLLFIYSRQQCHQLDVGRVDRIDVFAIFSKMVVCGNISTISYVRGNKSRHSFSSGSELIHLQLFLH